MAPAKVSTPTPESTSAPPEIVPVKVPAVAALIVNTPEEDVARFPEPLTLPVLAVKPILEAETLLLRTIFR